MTPVWTNEGPRVKKVSLIKTSYAINIAFDEVLANELFGAQILGYGWLSISDVDSGCKGKFL